MKQAKINYRHDYICSGCGSTGVKLWRDYNTCASAVEMKCAECATTAQVAYEARNADIYKNAGMSALDSDGVFTFSDGDQLGGLVPAVPTPEGETFWGYSSVPASDVEWWHELPTYRDDRRERRCLIVLTERALTRAKGVMKMLQEARDEAAALRRRLKLPEFGAYGTYRFEQNFDPDDVPISELREILRGAMSFKHTLIAEWIKTRDEVTDLHWKLGRLLYMFTTASELVVWGTSTKDLGDGMVIRYGEEQPRRVAAGDRIALHNGRAMLLDNEVDSIDRAWSVMDHGQDGEGLFRDLLARELIRPAVA